MDTYQDDIELDKKIEVETKGINTQIIAKRIPPGTWTMR
jgi:hypothetical protein